MVREMIFVGIRGTGLKKARLQKVVEKIAGSRFGKELIYSESSTPR